MRASLLIISLFSSSFQCIYCFSTSSLKRFSIVRDQSVSKSSLQVTSVFNSDRIDESSLKYQILQLGATLDRGQMFNPTSGEQYSGNMKVARSKVDKLVSLQQKNYTLEEMDGEWELVFSTVPHGIFRSSPFFLAIQEAYRQAGKPEEALLFFKLHVSSFILI